MPGSAGPSDRSVFLSLELGERSEAPWARGEFRGSLGPVGQSEADPQRVAIELIDAQVNHSLVLAGRYFNVDRFGFLRRVDRFDSPLDNGLATIPLLGPRLLSGNPPPASPLKPLLASSRP